MASATPPAARVAASTDSPSASPSARLKLHDSTSGVSAATRNSIVNSSARGWSPLQINKRDSSNPGTPLRPDHTGGSLSGSTNGAASGSSRRTSSSFRHMATNSLVAKSPFKDLKTREGALSNGRKVSSDNVVIHERRSNNRALGQTPKAAYGSANTPKNVIGLGIATPSRNISGNGSALNGTRKVSNERKVSIPHSVSVDRIPSGERLKENVTPRRNMPRKSLAYKATVDGERVTRSPFLSERNNAPSSPEDDYYTSEMLTSPSPRRSSSGSISNRRRASPSTNLTSNRTSMSPSPSPQASRHTSSSSATNVQASPLSKEIATPVPPSPTPTKSAMASSRRLVGPRGQGAESPTRKTVTFQSIPDVKEFEVPSREISMDQIPVAPEEDDEWVTDDNAELHWVGATVIAQERDRDASQDSEDLMQSMGDTSATADFLDSLYDETPFSPPQQEEHAFHDDSEYEIPMESFSEYITDLDAASATESSDAVATPIAATTPIMEQVPLPPKSPHHVSVSHPNLLPGEQPRLPHNEDHHMLLNGDVSQPAINAEHSFTSSGPHAHQQGAMYDPFITLQTATDVLVDHKERSENGVPLGRTSHAERVQAARMLATQKLGLGFPGQAPRVAPGDSESSESDQDSPVIHEKPLADNDVFGAVISSPAPRKVSNRNVSERKVSDVPELQGPSKRMAQFRSTKTATPTKRQSMPTPAPVEVPSPVQLVSPRTTSNSTDDSTTSSLSTNSASSASVVNRLSLPLSLPSFNSSPLMSTASLVPSDSEHTAVQAERELPALPTERTWESSPRLSLDPELEKSAAEAKEAEGAQTPRISSDPPQLALSPDVDEVEQALSSVMIEDTILFEDNDEEEDEAPLTPPPALGRKVREESPRIPSFEFGDDGFGIAGEDAESNDEHSDSPSTPRPITIVTSPSPAPSTPTQDSTSRFTPTASPSRSLGSPSTPPRSLGSPAGTPTRSTPSRVGARSPLALDSFMAESVETMKEEETEVSIVTSEFGINAAGSDVSDASTTTRIRQRISRDMIRETVNQRVAAGLPPRPASMIDAPRRRNVSPLRITKSPRTGPASPRSPIGPTASSVLQQLRASNDSPQSALDRIMNAFGKDESMAEEGPSSPLSPTKVITPVSILRQPKTSDEDVLVAPSVRGSIVDDPRALQAARKSRRRSASTGDASPRRITSPRLTLGLGDDNESILDSVRDEFDHIGSQRGYRVRERSNVRVTYTGSLNESQAGDLQVGKAWRPVRRPSDMNEHSKELRAARARQATEGTATGTIFVKVLGVEALQLPLPTEQTHFCITLDNGIDYIRTPYTVLTDGAHINQEFSLVEHPNFEFSLALDVRRDPHIAKLLDDKAKAKAALAASVASVPAPAPAPARLEPPRPQTPSSVTSRSGFGAGLRSLFHHSPRKNRHQRTQSTPSILSQSTSVLPGRRTAPAPPAAPQDTLAKFFVETAGNTIAKTHIAFKPIAKQCEGKVLEIRYPMFAMFKKEGETQRQQVAKITIQVLRLPPLPGLAPEDMPGSIEETLRGLRHHAWHTLEYNEGVLTQVGGDCRVPRRRLFRLVGGNLLCINEVTKKEVSSIDLKQATAVVDLNAPSKHDDYDPYSARPRSFQLRFTDGETINFTADKDEDKAVW